MDYVTKATRAIIQLGNIELDVFQMPNGEYFISSTNIANLLGMTEKSFLPKYMSEELKSKLAIHPRSVLLGKKVAIEGNNVKINAIPIELVSLICSLFAKKGNTVAEAILEAALIEALERRADSAFGLARSEEERNARLEARMKGKLTRRTLTDAIQAWIETNNPSDNYRKWAYANCTDQINLAIFGDRASKLRAKLNIKQIRDACNAKQIKELDLIEELICREIEEGGLEPLEATKFVLATQRVRSLPLV